MKRAIIALVVVGAFIGITLKMMKLGNVECEVCINFNGQHQCAHATGPDQSSALEEAHRSACSVVAGGVTETLECDRSPALSTKCSSP